jgi:hypothetical protein
MLLLTIRFSGRCDRKGEHGGIFHTAALLFRYLLDMMCGYTYLRGGDQEYTQWHQSRIFVINSALSSEMM